MTNTQTTTSVPTQQGAPQPSVLGSFAPLLLIILAAYFLMIRPQQKQEAKKKKMRSELKKGDRVVTASGIIGTVHKVISDDEVSFEVAEGVRIRILKGAITNLLDKNNSLGKNLVEEKSVSDKAEKKAAKSKSKEKKESK